MGVRLCLYVCVAVTGTLSTLGRPLCLSIRGHCHSNSTITQPRGHVINLSKAKQTGQEFNFTNWQLRQGTDRKRNLPSKVQMVKLYVTYK